MIYIYVFIQFIIVSWALVHETYSRLYLTTYSHICLRTILMGMFMNYAHKPIHELIHKYYLKFVCDRTFKLSYITWTLKNDFMFNLFINGTNLTIKYQIIYKPIGSFTIVICVYNQVTFYLYFNCIVKI